MVSAAAAKKCARFCHAGCSSPPSRNHASCTSAVAWSVCPGASPASFGPPICAVRRRGSTGARRRARDLAPHFRHSRADVDRDGTSAQVPGGRPWWRGNQQPDCPPDAVCYCSRVTVLLPCAAGATTQSEHRSSNTNHSPMILSRVLRWLDAFVGLAWAREPTYRPTRRLRSLIIGISARFSPTIVSLATGRIRANARRSFGWISVRKRSRKRRSFRAIPGRASWCGASSRRTRTTSCRRPNRARNSRPVKRNCSALGF